jgi:superfamily II DNA or RNA helicase
MQFYPHYTDNNFSDVLTKYEFENNKSGKKLNHIYQEPHQILIQNYLSKHTIYDNILLYHQLGSGKTCSSISIAEGLKEYITNMGRKIVVLVKNKNIQTNYMNELLSRCTGDTYLSDEKRNLYFATNLSKQDIEKKTTLANDVHKQIHKIYHFYTYGKFVNQVLGTKEYEKDQLGRNTSKVKKEDGNVKRNTSKAALNNLSNCVIIVDEAHNITNNDVYTALFEILSRSFNYKLILLTATPIYDNPREIFELSNLLNCNDEKMLLPIRNNLYNPPFIEKYKSKYINNNVLKGGVVSITNLGLENLQQAMYGKVSFLRENVLTNPQKHVKGKQLIPDRLGTTNVVYCNMSREQYLTYLTALNTDLKASSNFDISSIKNIESTENVFEHTLNISKTSSLYKNSSDASTMSYPEGKFGKLGFLSIFDSRNESNYYIKKEYLNVLTTDLNKYSSKLFKLLTFVNASPGNVFIYSNYVSFGGTSLIAQVLLNNGYKPYPSSNTEYKCYIVYDESTKVELREKYRRIFNSPENKDGKLIKIIIGSPMISEGITLKNVRQVHILEPSWNMSKINQIIGRAVRNYSHHDLPEKDRNVEIYKYVSVYTNAPKTNSYMQFFIDREKYILSEEKDRTNKAVERRLKEISFDCHFNLDRNMMDSKYDHQPECDYEKCNYNCKIHINTNKSLDKSTYYLYMQTFEKHNIQYIISIVRDLFLKHFIWSLNDIIDYVANLEPNIGKEVIYYTLGYITSTKTPFIDLYNRDGFIINKGDLYIFNSFDVDIESSIYKKILDFTIDSNKYTLKEYVQQNSDTDIFAEDKPKVEHNPEPKENVKLSNIDEQFNDNIIQNNKVFGTFRQRGTKDYPYGPKDTKFRIVDMRKIKQDTLDNRKTLSGMFIGSYKKPQLVDIAKFLKIPTKTSWDNLDKNDLGKLIQQFLVESEMVLK